MNHMKKTAFAVIVLLLGAGVAGAQQAAPTPRPGGPPQRDPIGESLFPPELVMQNQQAIGLTPEQKTQIRTELTKAQTRFTEMQWQLQDAMESLVTMVRQDAVDEAQALAQLEKVLTIEREIKRTQLGLMLRIKARLTPEQRGQLQKLRERPSE